MYVLVYLFSWCYEGWRVGVAISLSWCLWHSYPLRFYFFHPLLWYYQDNGIYIPICRYWNKYLMQMLSYTNHHRLAFILSPFLLMTVSKAFTDWWESCSIPVITIMSSAYLILFTFLPPIFYLRLCFLHPSGLFLHKCFKKSGDITQPCLTPLSIHISSVSADAATLCFQYKIFIHL